MASFLSPTCDFESWIQQAPGISPVTPENFADFADKLAREKDEDSFLTSPAFYAMIGREGLWVFERDGTFIPFCRHPDIDGQILVFPPRGRANFAVITAFLNNAPEPDAGFVLARFKPADIDKLQFSYAFVQRVGFYPVREEFLHWRYPARLLSTKETAALAGRAFAEIRNHIRLAQKNAITVCPLQPEHFAETQALAEKQNDGQAIATWRLFSEGRLPARGIVFLVNGSVAAAALWDVSNRSKPTANLHMNLCDYALPGLAEALIHHIAGILQAEDITELNLGGSRTTNCDLFKKEFPAARTIELISIKTFFNDAADLPFTGAGFGFKAAS